ncbi:MAG: ABC transporter ATP-binding protein [Pseudomonadota bacterium]|nr:ABC transporter ATP-binding protein [Pseudomonadota bacterium]
MSNVLTIRDLSVGFQVQDSFVSAVDGVSFAIRQGSTIALVGESGSGKSTIAQAIMGILPKVARISGGEIVLHDPQNGAPDTDITKLKRDGAAMRSIRGGRVSIIFQEPMTSLSQLHTVGNQVGEALHLHRDVNRATGRELTIETLRLAGFPDPAGAYKSYPFELSGGLRQRAMIAMALICRPALLIADEPTTALDVTIQAQILKLIADLQAELGMAVLMITHDLGVVANVAEAVVVMYHGKIMESGSLDDIFRNSKHPYLKALLDAVPRFHMAEGERLVPIRAIEPVKPILLQQNAEPGATATPGAVPTDNDKPLLSVRNLSKTFSLRKQGWFSAGDANVAIAVDDVSFDIKRGECLGLVGESGCGKTTTSKLIMRALTADGGTVSYNENGHDIDVLGLDPEELLAFRRKVQFIFQDPFGSLNPRMTAFDIISEPLIIHNVGSNQERIDLVRELMRLVGLDVRFLRRYPHSFSGGQRQRLGIARALALRPQLLICDEPVSSLDVSIQAQILNLLKDLKSQLGLTYLFVTHNLAVVDYMADRIAVMCAGRLVELATPQQLFNNPVHPYTRTLLAAVPYPDPDRRLDFDEVLKNRTPDPTAWPAPFTINGTVSTAMVDVGGGHTVRAAADANLSEIA